MGLLSWLFSKPEPPEPLSQWRVRPKDDDDPFGPREPISLATVLEVRRGWVRYKIGDGTVFPDERMPVKLFLYVYRKVPE